MMPKLFCIDINSIIRKRRECIIHPYKSRTSIFVSMRKVNVYLELEARRIQCGLFYDCNFLTSS
jgi:hypothetical protein